MSISQPYIRPIVRGKAKAPVEFGAKLDLSIDEKGIARLERLSFDAYNESDVLITAVENYKSRIGHYPERVLVDQIYRNRSNRAFCTEHGIRISGPALGRPKKDDKADKKQEYIDNTDRIEVERAFSLAKRKYGLLSWVANHKVGHDNPECNRFIYHCNERKPLDSGFVCSNLYFSIFKVQTVHSTEKIYTKQAL